MPARWRRPASRRSTPSAEQQAVSPEALADLLDDVRELRLTLALDLSAAAGAAEAGDDAVTASIVEADRQELAAFMRDATARLRGLEDETSKQPVAATSSPCRRRALISLPAVPLVGALAVSAAAAAGALPVPGHSSSRQLERPSATASAPVTSTFQQFETVLNEDPSASEVIDAASALHQQMAALLDTATTDPSRVAEVAKLLQLEQALLLRTKAPGSSVVLAASRQLVARLMKLAPTVAVSPSSTTYYAMPTTQPSRHHHATASPAPTQASTSPTSSTSTAATSPSPTPSSTSPSGYPTKIPYVGG
jgi:hypothetical protein